MKEVKHQSTSSDLNSLFKEEEDITVRVSPYCNRTGKEININYYISKVGPLLFTLNLTVNKNEDKTTM